MPATPLFDMAVLNGPQAQFGFRSQYAPSGDGQQFLLNVPIKTGPPITVMVNWTAALDAER